MAMVALMWEARAQDGKGAELAEWAREQPLPSPPLRHELFVAPEDRVLVITWWEGDLDAVVPELPEAPEDLMRRPVHRWRFTSLGTAR